MMDLQLCLMMAVWLFSGGCIGMPNQSRGIIQSSQAILGHSSNVAFSKVPQSKGLGKNPSNPAIKSQFHDHEIDDVAVLGITPSLPLGHRSQELIRNTLPISKSAESDDFTVEKFSASQSIDNVKFHASASSNWVANPTVAPLSGGLVYTTPLEPFSEGSESKDRTASDVSVVTVLLPGGEIQNQSPTKLLKYMEQSAAGKVKTQSEKSSFSTNIFTHSSSVKDGKSSQVIGRLGGVIAQSSKLESSESFILKPSIKSHNYKTVLLQTISPSLIHLDDITTGEEPVISKTAITGTQTRSEFPQYLTSVSKTEISPSVSQGNTSRRTALVSNSSGFSLDVWSTIDSDLVTESHRSSVSVLSVGPLISSSTSYETGIGYSNVAMATTGIASLSDGNLRTLETRHMVIQTESDTMATTPLSSVIAMATEKNKIVSSRYDDLSPTSSLSLYKNNQYTHESETSLKTILTVSGVLNVASRSVTEAKVSATLSVKEMVESSEAVGKDVKYTKGDESATTPSNAKTTKPDPPIITKPPGKVIKKPIYGTTKITQSTSPRTNPRTTLPMRTTPKSTYRTTLSYRKTTLKPQAKVTPEPTEPPLFITFKILMSWYQFCYLRHEFQSIISKIIHIETGYSMRSKQIILMFIDNKCGGYDKPILHRRSAEIFVDFYIVDNEGNYDLHLTDMMIEVMERGIRILDGTSFKGKVLGYIVNGSRMPSSSSHLQHNTLSTGIVAAIVIATIAGICFVLLVVLQVILRRRRGRKMRAYTYEAYDHHPSYDITGMPDSIALTSLSRMQHARSGYINPGLEMEKSPEDCANAVNFAGLTHMCADADGLSEEYQLLPNHMPQLSDVPLGAEDKNRYANVIPVPETRVNLTLEPGDSNSDYINANFVRGYAGDICYIATQAPMENTATDFWRMIWEQQSQVIVMLTGLEENGLSKCAHYWPNCDGVDNVQVYGDYEVTLKEKEMFADHVICHLTLKDLERNLCRKVSHIWYKDWPEQGVPVSPRDVVLFLLKIRPLMEDSHGPSVIHCSPGTGRTGTLMAVESCMQEFDDNHSADIYSCVLRLREDRAGAVQTKEQYGFIYNALMEYAHLLTNPSPVPSSAASSIQRLENLEKY